MSTWLLAYDHYDPAAEGVRESLCTLGNGYFATRGAAPEARADGIHYPGTYVAGCYDRLSSTVGDRTVENEDIVNAPNWLPLRFRVEDGEWFSSEQPLSYRQELDLRRGVLTRQLRLRDSAGRVVRLTQRRIVSMDDPHLAALETTLVPENWSGRLEVRSAIDGQVTNSGVARYRDLSGGHLISVSEGDDGEDGDEVTWLRTRTVTSRIEFAVAARNRVTNGAGLLKRVVQREPGWIAHDMIVEVVRGEPVTVEKTVALFTSRDRAIDDCVNAARTWSERAPGFATLLERHVVAWERLWRRCRIEVGRPDVQQVLNLHIFHLLQTVSEHTVELDVGLPARGLHGEAYRGHVFWDELFVLPFFNLRFPEISRALLMYRWRRLPRARQEARASGYAGAMFPWQSGSTGGEETPRLHLNPRSGRWLPDHTHLQRHVGLAVAYNTWRYYEATGDLEFLADYGAEMLVEISRFWVSLAAYNRPLDRYEIRGVLGPDEYHDSYPDRPDPGIDNNSYTNVMVVWVLRRTLDTLELLPPYRRDELFARLRLTGADIGRFRDVSKKMRVVFEDGAISQFEGYGNLAELDWASYRTTYGDIRRLDRILEAEGDTVNRYQASKQADVVMLCYLLASEELADVLTGLGYRYDHDLIPRTVSRYMARTSHGSTLSALVHAWVLARVDRTQSWRFFQEMLRSDIDDVQRGTTAEGIHIGAMAGTVDLVQRCYAGVGTRGETLRLDPRFPPELVCIRLELCYRGRWGVDVDCQRDRLRVALHPGAGSAITVAFQDQRVVIEPGGSWETALHSST